MKKLGLRGCLKFEMLECFGNHSTLAFMDSKASSYLSSNIFEELAIFLSRPPLSSSEEPPLNVEACIFRKTFTRKSSRQPFDVGPTDGDLDLLEVSLDDDMALNR